MDRKMLVEFLSPISERLADSPEIDKRYAILRKKIASYGLEAQEIEAIVDAAGDIVAIAEFGAIHTGFIYGVRFTDSQR